ncbi:CRISPR-associated protein Csb2 [Actinomadura pelletieri DSM 43383]|uniref:CRISPR-associated protein Csb2 n=1 Tax=Actinomadura pelletieri DSM 43383 TaxID=1120940 RepID=A0A495Q9V8_9ACTN|nr:type I-U CRISPR-associated protein Csb2 [Actinomadura pelletieri]RKS68273.1 CRISPR-associated protein Csb2 [Actinomadura pelletieri DSM 43383]
MPLSIVVRLRDGRYDAGGSEQHLPEWPPHPARVFCAMVASVMAEEDWDALRWLENAGAPQVWAAPGYASKRREGFVVTNVTAGKGTSQHQLGRTAQAKIRMSAEPESDEFAFVWPTSSPASTTLRVLRSLARRVPYLGRSTSPVTLQVLDEVPPMRAEWTTLEPAQPSDPNTILLRAPYGGYVDRLRQIYAEGGRSWEANLDCIKPYSYPKQAPTEPPAVSPFDELLIFGFESGTVKPAGEMLLAVTERLRAAVLDRIGTDVPPEVSGHGADASTHVGYLALPNVGNRHADGRLLGVAVAVPRELRRQAYARLWGALVERPLQRLTLRRNQVLKLDYLPSTALTWGLQAERWTAAGRGGSPSWVTATPMMLDRFPKRARGDDGVIKEVGRSLVRAGLPEPVEWEFSPAAMIPGALHRPRRDTIPSHRPCKPIVHVRVTFDRPVIGPVLAGAMRYGGLGLFVPAEEKPYGLHR